MSSSLTHLTPPSSQPPSRSARLLTPTTQPIPLLYAPVAKTYSIAHTLVILAYYYLRSGVLIANPLPTLIQDLVPLSIVQCAFCATCLPAAGTWISGTNAGKILEGTATPSKGTKSTGTGSMRRKAAGKGAVGKTESESWGARITPTVLSLILALTLPTLPLTALSLVMGAPLYPTSLLPLTLLLAAHVSLLGFLPIFYTHGVSSSAWRDVAAAWLPFDEAGIWAGTVGCMVGGWVGAIPMALDWDREWQKWPCTVLWGAVLGWAVGRVLTGKGLLGLGIGVRINLSEKEILLDHGKKTD